MICLYGVCNQSFLYSLFWSLVNVISWLNTSLIVVLGFVGDLHPDKNSDNGKHVLYTHKIINFKYNKDQVCGY